MKEDKSKKVKKNKITKVVKQGISSPYQVATD